MNTKSRLNLSAFILGLTSMIGQILVIRELVVTFYGNELSLGIILASWLFWISFGSNIAGRLVDRIRSRERLLSHVQLATSISLPLSIFLIRNIKSILNISTGKIIGFMPMLVSSFVSLSFICILLGFTFILLSRMSSENSKTPSRDTGRIYLLEGLGASIGGLIYSLFLIKGLAPFQNTLILGCVNLAISLLFSRNILQILYLMAFSLTFIFNWSSHLERYTRGIQFRPFELIETTDSIYGNIAVTKTGAEFSFYENGLLVFTSGDSLTSEESVHYAMLEHPAPKQILLIGGGLGGGLKEILKHPIKKVDYVELDPAIIKLAKKYIALPRDPRVAIVPMDGRAFVKKKYTGYGTTSSLSEKYDVIILNLPDPYTAMLNRFYSVEFFGEITKILANDGVFSLRLSSSENYISQEQGYYLASIYNTLKKQFQDVKILPGDTATFLASNKSGMLTYDSDILIERLKTRGITTRFVREYYLPFKLKDLRIKYIEDSIKEFGDAKINKDFRPIGYLYHTSLWMSLFHSGKGILPYLEKINLNLFISVVTFLFILGFLIQRLKKTPFKIPLVLSIGTTGMSEISFQIIVILAFQFLYGYMYYRIGAILTSFMIGLVMGSFFITRVLGRIKNEIALYLKTQFFICLYPLILPLLFIYIARINLADPHIGNRLQLSFVLLPIVAGFMGGFQFPLANKIALKNSQRSAKTTGVLYSTDLLGSCIGGLLIGVILVPILGIIESCILLFIINTLVLILLASNRSPD